MIKNFIVLSSCFLLYSCSTVEPTLNVESQSVTPSFRDYPAHVVKVYDGDTITAEIDLGFDLELEESVRLYGIDAPEIRGDDRESGLVTREVLVNLVLDKDVILRVPSKEREKYGRILAIVIIDGENVNEFLVEENLAERY